MIVRDDLVDYEALWVYSGHRPIATIRAHCEPVACDVQTRRLLYDVDRSLSVLGLIARRAPHRRKRAA